MLIYFSKGFHGKNGKKITGFKKRTAFDKKYHELFCIAKHLGIFGLTLSCNNFRIRSLRKTLRAKLIPPNRILKK
jgi:hypothetical protein